MNVYDEFYIPEDIEDKLRCSLAKMAKEALNQNNILENILQKYTKSYNLTFKERCSAKSLQVMNQNHKPIFSTITPSGVIRSPRCFSISAKNGASCSEKVNDKLQTPRKQSQVISSMESTRLFDDTNMECDRTDKKHSDENQDNSTSFNEGPSTSFFNVDKMIKVTFGSPVRSKEDNDKFYGSSNIHQQESFNLYGKPETMTRFPICNQDTSNESTETHQEQTMIINPENEINLNNILDESNSVKDLKTTLEIPDFKNKVKLLNYPGSLDTHTQEKFSLDGKQEAITSLAVSEQDTASHSNETSDKHQSLVNSSPKINKTPETHDSLDKYPIIKRQSLCSEDGIEISSKPETKEQELSSSEEISETASSLSVDGHDPYASNKTHKNFLTPGLGDDKEITLHSTNVNFSNDVDIITSNKCSLNKRKSVDYSKIDVITSSLASDQEFIIPPKLLKTDDELNLNKTPGKSDAFAVKSRSFYTNEKISKNHNNSVNAEEFAMDDDDSINLDKSSIDSSKLFNSAKKTNEPKQIGNHCLDAQEIVNANENYLKKNTSAILTNNNNSKISDKMAYQKLEAQSCASHFSPKGEQKKMVDTTTNISGSENSETRIGYAASNRTKNVESLTNLMQNLSPSVKRSFDGTSQRSVSRDETFVKQLFQRDNLLKTSPQQTENLVSDKTSPKLAGSNAIAEKFVEMLNERKSRLFMYLQLFSEDQNDFLFICKYIKKITRVIEQLITEESTDSFSDELAESIIDFVKKSSKLLTKATSWESDIKKDGEVWKNCFQKINLIEHYIKKLRGEKIDVILNELQKWETRLRLVSKTADDMILLREIRRPTVLQFGFELENFIQTFIQISVQIGVLKPCDKVS